MTEAREPMTAQEVAARWRVSVWTVSQMTRDGRLAKIPGLGRIRIPVAAVEAMEEAYIGTNAEPIRKAQAKAQPPRNRKRLQAHRPLSGAPVGGSSPVRGRVGPAAGDVVVRRVQG